MAGTAQRSVRARASQRVVRDLSRPVLSASTLDVGRDLLDAAHRHRLGAHAVALAYRVLISLVPLALLSIALMGAFGARERLAGVDLADAAQASHAFRRGRGRRHSSGDLRAQRSGAA